MKKITINESVIRQIYKSLITESKESKARTRVRKLFREKIKDCDEATSAKMDEKLHTIIRGATVCDFMFYLAVARMWVNKDFKLDGSEADNEKVNKLNKCMYYIGKHPEGWDKNLNGLSADALINEVIPKVEALSQEESDSLGTQEHKTTDYEIVKITSFEEASRYSGLVSWCITYDNGLWNRYTHRGRLPFYFCLKNGYENVERVQGDNCPLDEYGLSMIAVCFDKQGSVKMCACRWNHTNGGADDMFTLSELVDIVGSEIYEIHKQIKEEEENKYKHIPQLLKQNTPLDKIFDDVKEVNEHVSIVVLDGKYNIVDNQKRELLLNEWYKAIHNPTKNLFIVINNNKANILNSDGYYIIRNNNKCNVTTLEGELVSDVWFDEISGDSNGVFIVKNNNKFNVLNSKGDLLFNEWFDGIRYEYGYYIIRNNGVWNASTLEGKILFNEWYERISVSENSIFVIQKDGKWNLLNNKGQYLLKGWVDNIMSVDANSFCVITNGQRPVYFETNDQASIDAANSALFLQENKAMNLMKRMRLL